MKIHPAPTRVPCCRPCDIVVLHLAGAGDDVEVWSYPSSYDEPRLARRLARLVRHLVENPGDVEKLAGAIVPAPDDKRA